MKPFNEWCEVCQGIGYTDGCKKCDDSYNNTALCVIENELACALAYPDKRVDYIISAMQAVHEHPLWGGFNKEHFQNRVECMLHGRC